MNLEPCPFCAHSRANAFYSDDFRQWTVQCGNCPVDIGWYATEAEAVAAWNRRPALAAAVQAEREACAQAAETAYVIDGGVGPTWRAGTQFGAENAAKAIRSRGPSPTIHAVGEWTVDRANIYRFYVGKRCLAFASAYDGQWYTFSPAGFSDQTGTAPDLDSAKRAAVDALVRQGWYAETTPTVDVLAVVREYLEARAQCNPCWSPAVKRYQVALDALRALVAPRTSLDPWVPQKGDVVRCKKIGVIRGNDDYEYAVGFGGAGVLGVRYDEMELVQRADVAPRTAEESSGVQQMMGFRVVPDVSVPPGEIYAIVDGRVAGKIVNVDAPTKGDGAKT